MEAKKYDVKSALLEKFNATGELTEDEGNFLKALDSRDRLFNRGEAIDPQEIENIQRFSPALDLVDTPMEENLQSYVDKSRFSEADMRLINRPKDIALNHGITSGLGTAGDVLSGDLKDAIFEAMGKMQVTALGAPDFDKFMDDVNRIRAEKLGKRGAQMEAFPDEAELGLEIGQGIRDLGIGIAGSNVAGKILGTAGKAAQFAFPVGEKLAKAGKVGKSIASGAAGAAAVEAADDNATLEEIQAAGLTGAALDAAIQGVTAAGGPIARITRSGLSAAREKLLDQAGEYAFRTIMPVRRAMVRAIERGADSREKIGRILLEENVIPRLPPFFFESQIPVRLDKAMKSAGTRLGAIRESAEEYGDKLIRTLYRDFETASIPEAEKAAALENIKAIEQGLKVNMTRVGERIQKAVDIDPVDVISTQYQASQILKEQAEQFINDPKKFRSVDDAVRLKGQFRAMLQQKGAMTESQRVAAMKVVEGVMADEIDNAVARSFLFQKRLGDNPSAKRIAEEYGSIAKEFDSLTSKIDKKGGFDKLTPDEKEQYLELFNTHQNLQMLYRVFAKSGDLLHEKGVAGAANNIISLRDALGGSAGAVLKGSPEAIAGGILTSKFLREKGVATAARGVQGLAKAVEALEMSVGGASVATKYLSDMRSLTPAIYLTLTRPDSPLNTHGFMIIDDPESLSEFSQRIAKDDDLTSIEKAQILTRVAKDRMIKLFKKDPEGKKADVETSPGFTGFRQNVDRVMGEPTMAPKR